MSKKPHNLPTFATIVPLSFVKLEGAIHLFYNFYRKAFYNLSVKGCPYDNSCIESFHSILKKEEVNLKKYKDFKDAYNAIFEFIEAWYNRERIHSSLNYRTPDEVYSNLEKLLVA